MIFLLISWATAAQTPSGITLEKTRRSLDTHLAALKSLFPNLQRNSVDQASGAAVLIVFAPTDERAEVLAKKPAAETLLGVPVRIDIIGATLKQQ